MFDDELKRQPGPNQRFTAQLPAWPGTVWASSFVNQSRKLCGPNCFQDNPTCAVRHRVPDLALKVYSRLVGPWLEFLGPNLGFGATKECFRERGGPPPKCGRGYTEYLAPATLWGGSPPFPKALFWCL